MEKITILNNGDIQIVGKIIELSKFIEFYNVPSANESTSEHYYSIFGKEENGDSHFMVGYNKNEKKELEMDFKKLITAMKENKNSNKIKTENFE